MLLPVGRVDAADFHGVAAMDHFSISQIDANMGGSAGIVGSLEEDQVTGSRLGCGYDAALPPPAFCGEPSKVETSTAVVDHIGHKAGTVKTAWAVSSPNIGRTQVLLCLGNQLSGFSGGLNLYGIQDTSDIQIEVGVKAVVPIAERKCHFARTANLRDGLSLCDFGANGNGDIGAAANFHGVALFVSKGDDTAGNSHHLPIHDGKNRRAAGNKNLHLAILNYHISGALIAISIQDAVVPIQINGRTEHDTIALGDLVNVIHLTLIGIEPVDQDALKIGGGEGDIAVFAVLAAFCAAFLAS